jgi:hypothetical protein
VSECECESVCLRVCCVRVRAVSDTEVSAVIDAWRAVAEGFGVGSLELAQILSPLAVRLQLSADGIRAAASALFSRFDVDGVRVCALLRLLPPRHTHTPTRTRMCTVILFCFCGLRNLSPLCRCGLCPLSSLLAGEGFSSPSCVP